MIKVSVIMPLYNAAGFLRESLESVLNQTLKEIEVICIDDASTDLTGHILREYAESDTRISINRNPVRMGAAESRNKGITLATGEYLIFLDGDDIFDKNMLELSYLEAKKTDVDIILMELKYVSSDDIYQKEKRCHSRAYRDRFSRRNFSIEDFLGYELANWPVEACNKLYRTDFILTEGITFQNLSSSNDVFFSVMSLFLASGIRVLDDERIMIYARVHDSETRISNHRDSVCRNKAMKRLKEELESRDMFRRYVSHYYYLCFVNFIAELEKIKEQDKRLVYYNYLKTVMLEELELEYYQNDSEKYIYDKLMKFALEDFNSEWFLKEGTLSIYLEKKAEKVKAFIKQCEEDNKKIAIWGAGINGNIFLEFCDKNGIRVNKIIDMSPKKIGQPFYDYTICGLEGLHDIQMVIVTGQDLYNDIRMRIDGINNKIEAIDLLSFLTII